MAALAKSITAQANSAHVTPVPVPPLEWIAASSVKTHLLALLTEVELSHEHFCN